MGKIIVTVDRTISPAYPVWMGKVMHPELECTGPAEYDLATQVSLWLHDNQKGSRVESGHVVYNYLKEHNMLESCLGLQDALEIQKLGVTVFQEVFGVHALYFWKSVYFGKSGDGYVVNDRRHVPSLINNRNRVVLSSRWLDCIWSNHTFAVRFV